MAASAVGAGASVIHEGTMTKRGQNWRTWKERLFSLNSNGILSYFEVENGFRSLKGTVDIRECTAILSAHKAGIKWPVGSDGVAAAGDPACCLALVLPSRTFYFVCRNTHFARVWALLLRAYATKLQEFFEEPVNGPSPFLDQEVLSIIEGIASLLPEFISAGAAGLRDAAEAVSGLVFCGGVGERARDATVSSGAVAQLTRLLQALPETDPARANVVQLLAMLAAGSEHRKVSIGQAAPYKILKDILGLGPSAAERANAAAILIDLLTGDQDRVNTVLDEGGAETVTYLLQHGTETQKLEAASIAIMHCVGPRKHAFFEAGAVTALVPLLRAPNATLVRRATCLLGHLAGGDGAGSRAEAILSCQGHDRLVVLLEHEDDAIRSDAAATLWNLAQFVPLESLPRYRTFHHAVVPLIQLLPTTSLEVRLSAVGALASIAHLSDELRNEIVRCPSALPALARLLASADTPTCVEAARVINNLTDGERDRPQRAHAAIAAGCVPPLIAMLVAREEEFDATRDETFCCAILDALMNFAWAGDGPCNTLVEAGVVPPLIFFLEGPPATARRAAQCVRNLSAFADRQPRAFGLVRAGAVPPLCSLLFSTDPETRVQAAAALRNMANGDKMTDPTLRLAIVADGRAVEGLVRMVDPADMRGSVQAINALCNLAQSDCVRPHLRRHAVHELCKGPAVASVSALDNDARHIAGLLQSCLSEPTPGNKFDVGSEYTAIVYVEADAVPVRAVANILTSNGVRLWTQPPTETSQVTPAIASDLCKCIVIACSKHTLASATLRAAVEHAQQAGKVVLGITVEPGYVPTGWLSEALGLAPTFDASSPPAAAAAIGSILESVPPSCKTEKVWGVS
eukprot:m.59857 g.59857  ORF g.59857 m.59857 type:complete len:860 (-) comp12260_c0_seq1:259-2838(-)